MGYAVGNNLYCQALSAANRFVPGLAVTHHAWKIENLCDPAPVFLPIKIDPQIHHFNILRRIAWRATAISCRGFPPTRSKAL